MYKYDILDLDNDFQVVKSSEKVIYNTDELLSLDEYVTEKYKIIDYPKMTSALSYRETDGGYGIDENSFGTLVLPGNNIKESVQGVRLYTAGNSSNHGKKYFNFSNFYKLCLIFSVRKIIKGNWINWYDEYLTPNEQHESFEQFKYDSIVYSLFESKSNQSSLRQIDYKDQLWDIKNEFFWMSVDKIKELSDEKGYDELYNDARTSPDRYVHKLLFGEERIYDRLSPDAKAVLDKATELVEKSMELRQVMANDENHLNSWDAGYAQLKLVWKEYFQEDFKEFRQLYKNLEDRMRPLVYELGFLLK
jgi:hypothetical protein